MGRHWLFGQRAVEATPAQLAATGAAGGSWAIDPVDGDRGYVRAEGGGPREQPQITTEKARAYSVNAYRSNPMARAIIDTYTSFIVGDSGVAVQCPDPSVRAVVDAWWNDPRNALEKLQPLLCRDWMLQGEIIHEYMVGPTTGVVRFSPIDPARVKRVNLDRGNPLWHRSLELVGADTEMMIVALDDETELRTGQVGFFPSWRALITDRRGTPFLTPVLDDLDAYNQVLSNLVDRTALARYMAFDVEVKGTQKDVDDFITARGGTHVPRSGSIEVHNESVKWNKMEVASGSFEDTNTAQSILTNVAGGVGLSKPWLAESEGANRATSLSMAEPILRRVGGVQREYLDIMTESARFVVDRAVAVGRLPKMIETIDANGNQVMVAPADLVRITGPEVAAADAQFSAQVMLNLSTGLEKMVSSGALTRDAAAVAAQKAWEQFVGQSMPKALVVKESSLDDVAAEMQRDKLPEKLQKIYLAVDKVITADEARQIVGIEGSLPPAAAATESRRSSEAAAGRDLPEQLSLLPQMHFHLPEAVEVQMRQDPVVIPAPIVTVEPAQVTVNVEPTPVTINVDPTPVSVTVPAQPAPVVHVAAPALPAPMVTVVGEQGAKSVSFKRDGKGQIVSAEVSD